VAQGPELLCCGSYGIEEALLLTGEGVGGGDLKRGQIRLDSVDYTIHYTNIKTASNFRTYFSHRDAAVKHLNFD
jgi:hypothetical protein